MKKQHLSSHSLLLVTVVVLVLVISAAPRASLGLDADGRGRGAVAGDHPGVQPTTSQATVRPSCQSTNPNRPCPPPPGRGSP